MPQKTILNTNVLKKRKITFCIIEILVQHLRRHPFDSPKHGDLQKGKKHFLCTKQSNEAAERISKFLIECFDRFYSVIPDPLLSNFLETFNSTLNAQRVFMTNLHFSPQNKLSDAEHQRSTPLHKQIPIQFAHFVILETRLPTPLNRKFTIKIVIHCFNRFSSLSSQTNPFLVSISLKIQF